MATNTAIADIQQEAQAFANQPGQTDPFSCPNTYVPTFPGLAGSFQVTYTMGCGTDRPSRDPLPYPAPNTCIRRGS